MTPPSNPNSIVVLYDENDRPLAVYNGSAVVLATQPALMMAGTDGVDAYIAKVTAARRVVVDGSEVTQPISSPMLDVLLSSRASEATLGLVLTALAAIFTRQGDGSQHTIVDASALPTGAATEATLVLIQTALDVALSTRASEATVAAIQASTANLDVALSTRASEATQLLIQAALDVALSTRASEATQLLIKAKTDNLDVALSTRATEATLLLIKAKTDNLDVALSTRASEATLATRASEATLALIKAKTDNLDVALSTRATEATLLLIKAKTDNLDVALSTRASEATLATRASEATLALIKAKTDNLDVALSTRASEATLALIKAKTDNLDVALSTRATEATLLLIKAKTDNLDVALSTRATEATQLLIKAKTDNLDVPLSGVRNGLPGDCRNGRTTYASANAAVAVTATAYVEQSTNAQRSFASASANDTAAGTGARTIEITYLDQTCAGPFTETVTLNGTVAVATVATNICFLEKLVVKTFGSGNSNAGIITLYVNNSGGGGTIATVGMNVFGTGATVGDNQTYSCRHYVPTGKKCRVTSMFATADASTLFILRCKDPTVSGVQETQRLFQAGPGYQGGIYPGLETITLTGPHRFVLFGIPSVNNTTVQASVDYFEYDA